MSAVLSNPGHPEYGVATIPFPIPHDQYAHCIRSGLHGKRLCGKNRVRPAAALGAALPGADAGAANVSVDFAADV